MSYGNPASTTPVSTCTRARAGAAGRAGNAASVDQTAAPPPPSVMEKRAELRGSDTGNNSQYCLLQGAQRRLTY